MSDTIFSGSGLAYLAPFGTPLPTNADSALNAAFVSLGEVHEDGLEHAFAVDKETIRNWDKLPIKTTSTSVEATFALTFLDDHELVVGAFYGSEVESQVGGFSKVLIGKPLDVAWALVIVTEDPGTERKRVYSLPRVEVSERSDQTIAPGEAGWGLTFSALYDRDFGGLGEVLFGDDITATS